MTIIPFPPSGWAESAGGLPAMVGNVPFPMKDAGRLAASVKLLRQDLTRASSFAAEARAMGGGVPSSERIETTGIRSVSVWMQSRWLQLSPSAAGLDTAAAVVGGARSAVVGGRKGPGNGRCAEGALRCTLHAPRMTPSYTPQWPARDHARLRRTHEDVT